MVKCACQLSFKDIESYREHIRNTKHPLIAQPDFKVEFPPYVSIPKEKRKDFILSIHASDIDIDIDVRDIGTYPADFIMSHLPDDLLIRIHTELFKRQILFHRFIRII